MVAEGVGRVVLAGYAALVASTTPALAQPIAGMTESQTAALIAAAVAVVFGCVGGYMLYVGLKNRRLARESALWPATGGTVLAADVSRRTSRDRKRATTSVYYSPNIRYSYTVAGRDYECGVVRFGSLESGSRKSAEEIVTRYPAGATVVVRHDPADPSRATLETHSAAGQQIFMGIVFIAIPTLILGIMAVVFTAGA
jgi:uncharacterized protein DUF3592